MTHPSRVSLVAAFAAVYVIWGSTYLAIRWGVAEIPPFLMAGGRFPGRRDSCSSHWPPTAARRGRPAPRLADDRAHRPADGCRRQRAGQLGAATRALRHRGPPGLDGAVLGNSRRLAAAEGARPPGHVILGLALGFTGVALLVNPTDVAGARALDAVGAGTIVVASLLWAAGSVYSRYAPQPASHWLSAGMQMLGGGVVLLAISRRPASSLRSTGSSVSPAAFGAWLYVSAFGSVAYGCYLWLLKASTPAKAATYAYVNPVIALVLGYLLAGEALSLWSLGCSAVVVAGVLLVVSR